MTTLAAPVGLNARRTIPNTPGDLDKITTLFDRIPVAKGGSMEIGGLWASDRDALIAEVAAQIVTFQTTNAMRSVDGVVDPGGGTLRLMDQLADAFGPHVAVSAQVVSPPDGRSEVMLGVSYVADPTTLPGRGLLAYSTAPQDSMRYLVRVEGSSIRWFGVVIGPAATSAAKPHINFTPTPIQGGYRDGNYESFAGWGQLWDDYTSVIGGQMVGAGVDQVLVLPFYMTAQSANLGRFNADWKEVVGAVVTAAFDAYDPMLLRDTYTFDRIVTSSFSNGYVAHMNFHNSGVGVGDCVDQAYDLDGVAGGSSWRPRNGVIYQNRSSPTGANPAGNIWYVGGRWTKFAPLYGGTLNTHACCRNHLLYHGLWFNSG